MESRAGDTPALVLTRGENRVTVELAHAEALVTALTGTATDLAEVLTAAGVYHA